MMAQEICSLQREFRFLSFISKNIVDIDVKKRTITRNEHVRRDWKREREYKGQDEIHPRNTDDSYSMGHGRRGDRGNETIEINENHFDKKIKSPRKNEKNKCGLILPEWLLVKSLRSCDDESKRETIMIRRWIEIVFVLIQLIRTCRKWQWLFIIFIRWLEGNRWCLYGGYFRCTCVSMFLRGMMMMMVIMMIRLD